MGQSKQESSSEVYCDVWLKRGILVSFEMMTVESRGFKAPYRRVF